MTREATLTTIQQAGTRPRRALRVALGALALVLGLSCLAFGGVVFASAHDSHPVEIDGTIADYHEITINGAYARNELRLTNDAHTYTIDGHQFHPALPQRFQKDARIQIWVDQGTANVLAITLYDEMGLNPTSYTTSAYDNPTLAFASTEGKAGALAVFGLALLIAGALSTLLRGKRRGAGIPRGTRGEPQAVPVALGPARAVDPQPYRPQHLPAMPAAPPSTAPSAAGVGAPAIPLSQAAPTTPAPNRQPRPASGVDVDQLPTQKSPAVPPTPTPTPDALPRPSDASNTLVDAAASPFAAWGVAPPAAAHPQASAPPGSLPDFPTERMPAASGAPPPGDVSEEPTRKSEAVAPPDLGGHGA